MIELLILYILQKREKTIYSIGKEIADLFGAITKPSVGSIYPAIKRLTKEGALNFFERISDGGKKFCYYFSTPKSIDIFKRYFFDSQSDNPSLFYTQLQARLAVMGLLKKSDKKLFIDESIKKINLFKTEIEKKLNDEFIEFDYYQKQLLHKSLQNLKELNNYMQGLSIEDVL